MVGLPSRGLCCLWAWIYLPSPWLPTPPTPPRFTGSPSQLINWLQSYSSRKAPLGLAPTLAPALPPLLAGCCNLTSPQNPAVLGLLPLEDQYHPFFPKLFIYLGFHEENCLPDDSLMTLPRLFQSSSVSSPLFKKLPVDGFSLAQLTPEPHLLHSGQLPELRPLSLL